MHGFKIGLFSLAFGAALAAAGGGAVAGARCARPDDVSVMRIIALQQELMDAALSCGDAARDNYNLFQTGYGPALRVSDGQLMAFFRRMNGRGGMAAYNKFKTDMASEAELRRVRNQAGFCAGAADNAARALAPLSGKAQKTSRRLAALREAAAGWPDAGTAWPVDACPPPPVKKAAVRHRRK